MPYDPIRYDQYPPCFGMEFAYHFDRLALALDTTVVPVAFEQLEYTSRRVLRDGTEWMPSLTLTVGTSFLP